MKKKNEEKMEYLRQYLRSKRAVENYALQIEELRAAQIMPSKNTSGMPTGKGGKTDLSDYISKLEKLEDKYNNAIKEYMSKCEKVIDSISNLKDEKQRMVLLLRYTQQNNQWEKVWQQMNELGEVYSLRQIFNIHGEALENLEVTDE